MAAVTHAVTTASTSNATSYTSGAFTPAANDLLVVFTSVTASTVTGSVSGSTGLTFTFMGNAVRNGSADTLSVWIANALASATSQTVTFNCTGDAGTGCVIFVASVSGMTRTGSSAGRQTSEQNNQASGGTPAPVFASACLTGNPTLGAVANATNPAGLTPPTNWTERGDTGYGTPTAGAEYVSRDSGFTGTTITWGSTSASAFCSLAIELDTTTPAQTVTPAPVTGAATAVAPILTLGGLSLAPSPVAGAASVVAPTLSNVLTLSVTPVSGAAGAVAPTLTVGAVSVAPTPVAGAAAVAAPTLELGGFTLTPTPVAGSAAVVAPSLANTITLLATPVSGVANVVAPVLELGGLTLAPSPALATSGVFGPTLAVGAVTVEPTPVVGAAVVAAPTLIHTGGGGGGTRVYPFVG